MFAKRTSITDSLATLPKCCTLDVSDISSDMNLITVRDPQDFWNMKYLLLEYPVVSKTYTAIAEASSQLASENGRKESVIAEIKTSGSIVTLQQVSPDATAVSAGDNTTKRRGVVPKACLQVTVKTLDSPPWVKQVCRSNRGKYL